MPRLATLGDVLDLVEMGRKFKDASGMVAPFNPEAARDFISTMIEAEAGVVFVSDAGMIGGALVPTYFSPEWLMAVELAWWSEGRDGLRLLAAFEGWARDMGASEIRMTTLASIPGPAKIMARKGYAPIEISYQKVI